MYIRCLGRFEEPNNNFLLEKFFVLSYFKTFFLLKLLICVVAFFCFVLFCFFLMFKIQISSFIGKIQITKKKKTQSETFISFIYLFIYTFFFYNLQSFRIIRNYKMRTGK